MVAHQSLPTGVPEVPGRNEPFLAIDWHMLLISDRSCCCPAKPAAVVLMPPTLDRPHVVELLLCGHHADVSREALAAAKAITFELP